MCFNAALASRMHSFITEFRGKTHSFAHTPLIPPNALVTNVFPMLSAGFPCCFYGSHHGAREGKIWCVIIEQHSCFLLASIYEFFSYFLFCVLIRIVLKFGIFSSIKFTPKDCLSCTYLPVQLMHFLKIWIQVFFLISVAQSMCNQDGNSA